MFKPNSIFYKILVGICSVTATVALVYLIVWAGNIDSPAIPSNDAGRMYTLKNIYDYLNSVDSAVPSKPSGGFSEPASAPGSTMYTLDDIFAKLVRLPATGQTTVYQTNDDGTYQSGATLRYADNGDGTISDSNTKLMWVKQPELIIPGATGVTSNNQIPNTDSNGNLVTKGDWATTTNYYVRDLVRAQQRAAGVNATRALKVVTAASGTPFTSADIGREIFIGATSQGIVTAYISSTVVWVTNSGTTGSGALTIRSLYYCTTAHTSDTFLTELAAGKWREKLFWATSTAYLVGDTAFAQQRDTGVNATQSTTTVTAASGTPFTSADVGRNLFIGTANCGVIRAVTSSTVVTVSLSQTIAAANVTIYSNYVCATAHTSDTFLTELAAGKWRETLWSNSTINLTTLLATTTADTLASPSLMRWDTAAIINCEALEYAGHTDWRLPNTKELFSIVLEEYSAITDVKAAGAPYINQTIFPSTVSSSYWSSTTIPLDTSSALDVFFNYGIVYLNFKTNSDYVRCVRGQ